MDLIYTKTLRLQELSERLLQQIETILSDIDNLEYFTYLSGEELKSIKEQSVVMEKLNEASNKLNNIFSWIL